MKEEGAPAWNTWPSAHNFEGWRLRRLDVLEYHINLVIRFKRRERWQLLKAELGKEYLEQVKDANKNGISVKEYTNKDVIDAMLSGQKYWRDRYE